ncbi:S-(+)-linalool synthase, chloroplastic-like isoform X2 [Hordeum vulgare subsp. vulgare]|nr:S-(+)-linalool synthase, chloroplastic-like isoform X2 [Hordeum vulgare subsp. vulgare]
MLHQNHKENRKVMTDIDHLKRLCIDHYFQDEIDDGMDACLNLVHSDDLLDATLSLRLLREAGHDISADEVLQKFVNENDDFNLDHTKDIRGLLSLQDISHLNMGEASLYKANDFSRKHLTSAIKHLDLNLARYVRHSLDHPYHVSLTQYKARHHLSYLQSLPTRNTAMEELALADFQLNKLQHQMEMQEVKRWWMGLGLAQEIPATRDQILKWYMFPMTILQGQSFSRYRIEITKIIAIVSIVDDIFDVIATQEELSRFTEAIKMWDLAAAASLPSYMRSCYSALYTITNDIADMAEREHGLNPIDHLKKDWTMLFDAFLLEAKWLSANQVPSLDDYLSNGVVTTGGPLALVHLFSMLGHDPTRDATNLTAGCIPPIISCPSKILRLWDDMGSAKDEAQDGLDGSYKELYLKENPGGNAEGHMRALIGSEWEELNRECFSRRAFPPSMTRISLNLARMVRVLFGYGEGQTLPVLEEYIRMLLL